MLKIAPLSLVALLAFVSPAFAEDAPSTPACLTIEVVKSTLIAKVEADLTGADLKRFGDNYSRSAKEPAPVLDRVLILSKPDAEDFMLVAAKDGCVIGYQPISPSVFRKWNGPAGDNGQI